MLNFSQSFAISCLIHDAFYISMAIGRPEISSVNLSELKSNQPLYSILIICEFHDSKPPVICTHLVTLHLYSAPINHFIPLNLIFEVRLSYVSDP